MPMISDIITFIFVFASVVISTSVLGLIAGFSPTLYIAQIATATKSKQATNYAIAIMAGVLVAILLLITLFQFIHLDTLLKIINSSVRAVTVSVGFNVIIGGLFIYTGIWYLRHQKTQQKTEKPKQVGGLTSVFGLGFFRTFASITGVTATYIAGNIVANVSNGYIENVIFTAVFMAGAIAPFVIILFYFRRDTRHLLLLTEKVRATMQRTNYRFVVGTGAIILGGAIIIFNIMMALFH